MTTYRAAIIGLNHYHVTGWAESLAQFPGRIDVVALYDADPQRGKSLCPDHVDPHLSRALPDWAATVPFYSSLSELLREQRPNLAVVTLSNADAPAGIETLATAGVHMLVDKPGARTAAEAERAFGLARESGVKVALGFTRRYGRAWQDAARLIEEGRLGRLLSAEAIFVTSSVTVRDPRNLIFSREAMGGGILHWLGVHDIDLLLWLSGQQIVELQAMAANTGGEAIEIEDAISVAVRFEAGALGTLHFAYALPRGGGEGYLALRGAKGSLTLTPSGELTWFGAGSAADPVISQTSTYDIQSGPGYGAAALRIIDDLLDAIEQDRDPLATGKHAVAALRVIDAAYQSASSGERVRLQVKEDINE